MWEQLSTLHASHVEIAIPLFPGIPLTVLDDIPITAGEPLAPTPTAPPDPPECVAKYAQLLKDKYQGMPTLPDGDWPPSLGRQYTRLAMIEQKRELPGAELVATMEKDYIHGNIDNIVKRKKAIQLHEIFLPTEDGKQQLKILMDGAPGVGKSTLSRKVCKDWASGQLLQQYHLVILLALRQASIREAKSIEDLIEADNPHLKQQVIRHIQETSGEHVLFILDGYDELSNEDRTQKSLFLDVVQGNKFPKCSVLVTSRPYASDYLQQLQSINRHVEVLGFTEEQIEHCIIDNLPDKTKATELVQTLKERQDIASLCYIPLNCAIVLYVYEREQCTLPHTLTKLYEKFIVNALKRHAKVIGNDPRSLRRLYTLKNLPEPLQQQLSALSMLAYSGLLADKMVFSTDDLEAVFPDCSDLDVDSYLLGLMTAFKEFTSTDEELSYQFLHLTIQEFLAARWAASQLSDGELLKFFQDHLREERYRMVLLFLAGISQLKLASAENLFRDELDCKHPVSREYSNRKVIDYFLFLAHLIYESQNFSLFHNLAGTIVGAELFTAWYHISPFDCLVLAHFLALCGCSMKLLDLSACGLTNQSLEIMHRVNLDHCGTTQIEEVNLSKNHPKLMTKLSLLPKLPMFEHTRVLKVNCPQYPEEVSCDQVELHCLLNLRHLTTLEVSVKVIADSSKMEYSLSLGKFIKVLKNNISELQVLQLGNIDSQNAVDIFRSLEHNTSLEELDLSGNRQLAEGDSEAVGCAIEKMLNVNRALKELNLSDCQVTDPIVKHILTGLTKNTSLAALDMGSPILSGSCAVPLFQQMTTHPTLSITVGEVNVLGVGGVKMDRGTVRCVMGDTVPENCVEFFRALNNSGLKVSNLNVGNLTNQTAKHFAVVLAESQSVQALKMSDGFGGNKNNIGSAGAVSIFRSLEHNTSVEELDLSGNRRLAEGDSEAVGCAIERMLNVNRTLKKLNLSCCQVTDPIVQHILTGLTKNTSLSTLDVGSSKLSGSCAVSLFQQMTTHTTVSIIGEVNILRVGRVKMDRGSLWWVIVDMIPENCVEFFRALNNSGLIISKLNVQNLTDQTAEHFAVVLAESQLVQALKLEYCNMSSTGVMTIFRSLEHNTILEELDLSRNSRLAEGDSEAVGCAIERMLNVNMTLKVLNLSGCSLGIAVVVFVFRSLEHNTILEELDLSGNRQLAVGNSEAVGCAIERMMNVNKTLKLLNLSGCRLDTAVANHIVAGLVKNDYLIQLNIERNCYVTSEGWVHVFKALCNNTSLKKLDINVNNVRMEGSVALVEMLSLNKSLTELSLQDCLIPEAGLREIARGLLKNTSLKKLDITHNKLGICGSVALAEMLSCNKSLTELNLQWCDIPEAGLREIPKGLLKNTSLKKLDISRNKLGMEGSVALAEMLSCNKSLTELDLSLCDIPEAGLREIARGLLQNTSLKKLDISGNKLGMEGSVALAEMLSCNKSLTELNLGWCDIPEAGLREIARGLLQNTSLQTINLEQKAFLEAEIERLKKSGNFTPQSSSRLEIKY